MPIRLKRAYDEIGADDGIRILVDRIWPRGVSKKDLQLDKWMKEIAPSDKLRQWFDHDPEKFEEFRRRYQQELDSNGERVRRLAEIARNQDLTLVYGAKDREHNHAVVLKEYLENYK